MYSKVKNFLLFMFTPLHELSHLTAAVLAGMKIVGVNLLNIFGKTDLLGQVKVKGRIDGIVIKIIGIAPFLVMMLLAQLIYDYMLVDKAVVFLLFLILLPAMMPSKKDVEFSSYNLDTAINSVIMLPTYLFVSLWERIERMGEGVQLIANIVLAYLLTIVITQYSAYTYLLIITSVILLVTHATENRPLFVMAKILFYLMYPLSLTFIAISLFSYFLGYDYISIISELIDEVMYFIDRIVETLMDIF